MADEPTDEDWRALDLEGHPLPERLRALEAEAQLRLTLARQPEPLAVKLLLWPLVAVLGLFAVGVIIAMIFGASGGLLAGIGVIAEWGSQSDGRRVVVALAVLAIGVGLYEFRRRQRVFYGLTETAAGVLVAWRASAASTSTVAAVALLGAAYIVVRGIDNIAVGIREDEAPKRPRPEPAPRHGESPEAFLLRWREADREWLKEERLRKVRARVADYDPAPGRPGAGKESR